MKIEMERISEHTTWSVGPVGEAVQIVVQRNEDRDRRTLGTLAMTAREALLLASALVDAAARHQTSNP